MDTSWHLTVLGYTFATAIAALLQVPAAFAQVSAAAPAAAPASRRPNVLIIFPDQLRWSALGCHGHPVVQSPHIDRLAEGGVRFTHAFSNFPVCSPARSILLSGQYARTTGVMSNQDSEAQPDRFTNRSTTLAEALAGAGYDTALIGKWHLAPSPPRLGFAESLRPRLRHRYYNQTYCRNEREVYIHEGYSPFHETDAAVSYIREHRDRPFFLFLTYGPPHMPVAEMPERYRKMYDPAKVVLRPNVWKDGKLAHDDEWFRIYMWDFQYYDHRSTFPRTLPADMDLRDLTALYYGQITAVDDCVGRVLAALREADMEEDTIVVFTSDHGDMLGSHQAFNKNLHYDESIHVPMIVRYPRRLRPGIIDGQIVSLVDVMPTVLELAGVTVPASVQGTSVAPVLTGAAEMVGENAAFIETTTSDGIRTPQYLYAVNRRQANSEQLFDLHADPYEMQNLSGDAGQHELRDKLLARLQAWRDRTPAAGQDEP